MSASASWCISVNQAKKILEFRTETEAWREEKIIEYEKLNWRVKRAWVLYPRENWNVQQTSDPKQTKLTNYKANSSELQILDHTGYWFKLMLCAFFNSYKEYAAVVWNSVLESVQRSATKLRLWMPDWDYERKLAVLNCLG